MYRSVFRIFILALLFAIPLFAQNNNSVSVQSFAEPENAQAIKNVRPVKNIIIMIGDGMGFDEVTAARVSRFGGSTGLAMDRFSVTGISLTYSLDEELITDSAASGTAIATGVRTYNGAISVNKKRKPLKTILELAKELGKGTGLVATSEITHATPAAFASHTESRKNANEIALQMSRNLPDVMLAGGYGFFLPSSDRKSYRKDNLNLINKIRTQGHTVITSPRRVFIR